MESIYFFLKSLVITFGAVMLMQIEMGGATVENHVLSFVHTSSVAQPIKLVADGGVKAVRNGWNTVSRWVNGNRPAVGERAASLFNIQRSEGYEKAAQKKREASSD